MDELELEPPITTAEELQAYADRMRERIPNYELLWLLYHVMWRVAWAEAKEESMENAALGTSVA